MKAAGEIAGDVDSSRVLAEPPRDASHGDVATNAALVLSKAVGMKPRDLAELLVPRIAADANV
ncbi:MAG: arginine--tRNA ligase, partial [Alphaproteobacteria bacterium]